MSAYNKILIDNIPVDLPDNIGPLFLTDRLIEDIDSTTRGDFSTTNLVIPKTKHNQSIVKGFGVLMDVVSISNGIEVFKGTAMRVKVNHNQNPYARERADSYELQITSNNSSWIQLLANTTLSELTEENVVFNETNVLLGFDSQPDLRNWAFAFIKWKQWEQGGGGAPNFRYMPSISEATPLLYIAPLIKEAFRLKGYTLVSEWLEHDEVKKYSMPVPIPERLPDAYSEAYLNTKATAGIINFPNGTSTGNLQCDTIEQTPINNPNAYDPIGFEYTVPLDGYYEVKISVTFSQFPPTPNRHFFVCEARLNGSTIPPRTQILYGVNTPLVPDIPYPAGQTINISSIVFAEQGDILTAEYLTQGGVILTAAAVEFNGQAVKKLGIDVDFKYLLDQDSFLEFLKGIKVIGKLSFLTNENTKTVFMDPSDGYILGGVHFDGFYKGPTRDLTEQIDLSKRSYEKATLSAANRFYKWGFDQDPTAEYLEEGATQGLYGSSFVSSVDSGKEDSTETEVPFFAGTLHVLDIEARHPQSAKVPQFPLIYSQNYILNPTSTEANYNVKRRLLYHAGTLPDGANGYIEIDGIGKYSAPSTFMVNFNADDPSTSPNLGFSDFTTLAGTSIGGLRRYYLQSLARTEIAKTRDSFVLLSRVDKLNFDFREKVLIDRKTYIPHKIKSEDPSSNEAINIVFLEDKNPTQETLLQKQDNLLNPVISQALTQQ